MYLSIYLCANSSQTNGRNYFKIAPMIDDVSGSAQKNFGDLTFKIKVTRGQKVNKGYNGHFN